jgi:hypothetical protein
VLPSQFDAPLKQLQHRACRHIVQMAEAVVGRQRTTPRGVHRESRVDPARAGQLATQRVSSRTQVGRRHPAIHHPRGQHLETCCRPGDDAAVAARPQPHHGRLVEAQRALDKGGQVLRLRGVGKPDAPFAHRAKRCRYAR